MPSGPDQPAVIRDFAEVWRAAGEVVDSPEAVRRIKEEADADLSLGPSLAASARRALTQRRSPES